MSVAALPRRPLLIAVLSAATLSANPLGAEAQPSSAERVRLMDSIAASPVREGRVAGLAVAVVQGKDTLLLRGYGKADLSWDVPMPADAVFEIGSVTKQFTAVAALQLRDQGKLDLDADISTYLPDYPTQGRRIPVRRLLDHTSGIKGYTEMASFRDIVTRDLPPDSLVVRIAAEPFDFEPGEALIYNNSAYFLLGLIIEKVSGMSYEDYIERNVFTKAAMPRSSYCSHRDVVPRKARGYTLTPNGLVQAPYIDHTWPYAAGSLCSTAGDLVAWIQALHGGRVLPAKSYQEMITPRALVDGTPVRYAMGLSRTPDAGGREAISHGGGIFGFVSDTRYYPDADLTVVVLVNSTGNLSATALAMELVDVVLPRKAVDRRPFTGEVTPLVGVYTGAGRGRPMTVTVSAGDTGPMVRINDGRPMPLQWVDGWTFSAGSQLAIFERRGEAGPATALRLDSGGGHLVLRRTND